MTDAAANLEQDVIVDATEHATASWESHIAGLDWDTHTAIVARVSNEAPELNDKKHDRIIVINPRQRSLFCLEELQLTIKSISVLLLTVNSINLFPVRKIETWPTRTEFGELQTVLVCENGHIFAVSKNGLEAVQSLSIDWQGEGPYKFCKHLSKA
jgi:hypothetical protein